MRPKQWVKNVFVAAPLVFAQKVTDLAAALDCLAAVALFCLVSGCVYVLNDLVDVEKDRAHPKKKLRPIPSGDLPVNVARAFVWIMVPLALGAAVLVTPWLSAALGAYFVLNLAYSFKLKNVAYLDVLSITAGFLLRVWGGSVAIDVAPSPWLLGCTASLAMFLGFGKRAHELLTEGSGGKTRSSLQAYNATALEWIMHTLGSVTVTIYVLYTQSAHVHAAFGDAPLIYTVPFPMIGILRFNYLVTNRPESESPTEEMLRDPLFLVNAGLWVAAVVSIIYGTGQGLFGP